MTDEEIEKALTCHSGNTFCSECAYRGIMGCRIQVNKEALDYIIRLKAERERLIEQLCQTEQKLAECENGYEGTLFLERCKAESDKEQIRKKTVREFAETLLSDEYIAYNDPEIVKEVAGKFGVEVDK